MTIDLNSDLYRASILSFFSKKQEVLGAYAWSNFQTSGKGIVIAEIDLLDDDYKTIVLGFLDHATVERDDSELSEARERLEATGTARLIREYKPQKEVVVGIVYLGEIKAFKIRTTPTPPQCQMNMPFKDVSPKEFMETYLGWSQSTVAAPLV
jgi:hypothetical protein